MRLLDTAEIGSMYRNRLLDAFGEKRANDRNGIVIPGGYAEPVDENWQEVYTPSKDEAVYFIHAGAALVLEVTKGFFHDPAHDNDLRVHLALPAPKDAVRDAVEAVGAVSVKACKFRCVDCLIPSLKEMINEAMDDASNPVPALETAELLRRKESQWSAEEFLKYKALLEASGCFDLADALGLMEELKQYELYPTVAQPWDYAELVLREKYPDLPAELFQTGQSAEIGRKMLEEGHDALTSYGLIRNKNGEPLPRFEPKQPEMQWQSMTRQSKPRKRGPESRGQQPTAKILSVS